MTFAAPALYAATLWWTLTGVILFLDGLPRDSFRWSLMGATIALLVALHTLHATAGFSGPAASYAAFTAAVFVWAWVEMSFLMGFVTGPRKHGCDPGCAGYSHFLHAWQAVVFHELAAVSAGLLIVAVTWGAVNRTGLWTFGVLWTMRISAKLNLFLGVANRGEQFLPDHLRYLTAYFGKRSINFLFPVSVTAATIALALLARLSLRFAATPQAAGIVLVTTLLALGLLEHWFMVLPLPSEKLWALASRANAEPARSPEPVDRGLLTYPEP